MPSHHLAFVKVLAAVAWADGTIQEDERNRIKLLLNSFGLDLDERKAVDALLSRPVGFDEALKLTKEFAEALAPPGARKRLLAEVEAMLGDEGGHSEGERELLRHIRAILQSHTALDGLVDRLRGLIGTTLFSRGDRSPAGTSRADRDEAFLAEISDDRPERDAELQRACAEYCRESTMDDRVRIVEELFARAARAGAISKTRAEHARRVATLLWVTWPEFLAVRERYRDRIEA